MRIVVLAEGVEHVGFEENKWLGGTVALISTTHTISIVVPQGLVSPRAPKRPRSGTETLDDASSDDGGLDGLMGSTRLEALLSRQYGAANRNYCIPLSCSLERCAHLQA